MPKIKLKFRSSLEEYVFYDKMWCGCNPRNYPQCEKCKRNSDNFENWDPLGYFTMWRPDKEGFERTQQGDCRLFSAQ